MLIRLLPPSRSFPPPRPFGISNEKNGSNSRDLIMAGKSSFLDKVLGRITRLDAEGLQSVMQRLAHERSLLETLFNTIEDGIMVVDEKGHILYFNQAVTRLLGLQS